MSDLVELQLRRSADKTDQESSTWKSLVQNILRVISETARESESKDTTALRTEIGECREQLARPLHPQEERQAAATCVKACDKYLRRLQLDSSARENELMEIVAILREATARFVGDSSDFNDQMLSSADRFKMMSRLDDIKDLKQQLSIEVTSFERVVEVKKQRDEAAMAKLSQRVDVLQADLVKAEEEAATDALTKIANRGTFDRTLPKMIEAAKKSGTPLTLGMIDVDHFKKINDAHGHPVGDRVLVCTAQWLKSAVRHTDFVARYGGEEFAVIMADADVKSAETRLAQVLQEIAGRSYEYDADGEQRSVRFTVSCGVSQFLNGDTVQDLIERADQGLYEAKQKGRNRVVARKPSRFARLLSRG